MNVANLLGELRNQGIQLWEEGGELRFRAPSGAMTAERRESLRQDKAAILDHLRNRTGLDLIHDPENRHCPFPLTDIQVAYVLGRRDSFAYGGVGCHGYGEISLANLDIGCLSRAWRTVVERHDMLRAIVLEDGTQRVLEDVPDFTIDVLDLRQSDPGLAEAELRAVRARMDHRVYEPDQWPLFDLRVTITPAAAILHFSIDLLVADFVSTQIILDELEQLLADDFASLPPVDVKYRDYVIAAEAIRHSDEYDRSRSYWMGRLDELPPAPDLPLLLATQEQAPRFRRYEADLFPERWAPFCANARKLELTPSTALLALFAEVVARWSSKPDFTLNVAIQNRLPLHPHVDRIVGDFTAVELLSVRHDLKRPLRARADTLQKRLWEDLDHRAFSGTDVIREMARNNHRGAVGFPVVFTSSIGLGADNAAPRRGLGKLLYGITQTPQVWIDCQAIEDRGTLKINWDVREGVFPPGLVDAMFDAFSDLLARASRGVGIWEEMDPIRIPAAQMERRRNPAGSGKAELRRLLHEDVVEQALRHPDRPAVIAGETMLTFGDLLARAGAVATAVRALGHSPGDCIALMLESGLEQCVAALGVLLAGCAYLPLVLDEPPARRRRVLDRLKIRTVLADSAEPCVDTGPEDIRTILIANLAAEGLPEGIPPRLVTSNSVAYVIASPNAAGDIEPIAVSHASAVNTFSAVNARCAIGSSDRVLAVSGFADCMSAYTLFGVLAVGGCLVLPQAKRREEPAHWIETMRTHGVTAWGSAVALLARLCVHLATEPIEETPLPLRLALLSANSTPVKLQPLARHCFPEMRLVMLAGVVPALWSTIREVNDRLSHWSGLACGEPILRGQIRICDDARRDCPDWIAGNAYVAGLARYGSGGCSHPGASCAGGAEGDEGLLRSRARARYRNDGLIELLGREERYCTLHNRGVHLDEIEAALAIDPLVARAAAVVDVSDGLNPRLVTFLEPARKPQRVPEQIRTRLVAAAEQAAARVPPPDFDADLDTAVRSSIRRALHLRGMLDTSLETLAPARRRLVRRWRHLLERAEPISCEPSASRAVNDDGLDRDEVAIQWQRLERKWESDRDKLQLTAACRCLADRLPDIVGGCELSDLRPYTLLDVVRTRAPLALWASRCIATMTAQLREGNANPLRIVELGGASHPLFDMNRPYRDQGFQPHSVDVIISQGALHAVRDIEACMGELTELLSPGGWMVFWEPVRDQDWIVGTLECFMDMDEATGDFLDRRAGRDQTFVSAEGWRDLVIRHGGELIASTAPDDHRAPSPGIAVFAARFGDGQVAPDAQHLIAAATRRMPVHMMPDHIELVSHLPLTLGTEIDYQRLANRLTIPLRASRLTRTERSGELEEIVAHLWSEVLQTANADRSKEFLAAGGDSLKAARLAGRLRERIPEASRMYFDELLHAILRGGTIAAVAARVEAAGKSEAESAPDGEARPAVATRGLGGAGKTAWVIVPDGLADLADNLQLAERLREHSAVLGVEIDNVHEFLRLPAETLLANAASSCLDEIVGDGRLDIAVLGIGSGCAFALELARQMSEAGGLTRQLILAPNTRPEKSTIADERLRRHWTAACLAWDAHAYAGDVMLVLPRDSETVGLEHTKRWSAMCLGTVSVLAVAHDASVAVADALLQRAEQWNDT